MDATGMHVASPAEISAKVNELHNEIRETPFAQSAAMLDEACSRLEHQIERLHDRLTPVLIVGDSTPESANTAPQPIQSPLVTYTEQVTRRVSRAADEAADLLARLEI